MGSIAGIISWAQPPTLADLQLMLEASPHRGSLRRTERVGDGAVLGISNHRDEDDASVAIDGSAGVVFLGTLDNRSELLSRLQAPSSRVSASPAEVVLLGHRAWGPLLFDRLRGAFAIVIVEGRSVWCVRDHLGFRPLFYRKEPGRLLAATEAKQVTAGAGIAREPNVEAIRTVFYSGISSDASVRGVKRVMSAEIVEAREENVIARRYWNPGANIESVRLSMTDAQDRLRALLDQAVRRTLTGADAIALSGGIDSTTIAAFAAVASETMPHRPFAYTFVYPDHASVDESQFTRVAADALRLRLVEHRLESGPLDDLEGWVDLADGPWDTLPIPWAVEGFRLARAEGANNVLYGDLAEYVFTVTSGLLGHLFYRGRWASLWTQLVSRRMRGGTRGGLARALIRELIPTPLINRYYRQTGRAQYHFPLWVDPAVAGTTRDLRLHDPQRKRWMTSQVYATRGTTTTLEANEIAAAVSRVTLRRPLADVDLWEFMLSLPAQIKFPDAVPKSLMRQTMRGLLPDAILDRPRKTVFDEHTLSTAQAGRLTELINPATFRLDGVDYGHLGRLLASGALSPNDVIWAQDLAKAHAFVDLFS